jgi:hypothetical protein
VQNLELLGLGVCELLDASSSRALPADFVMEELGLSPSQYRKLLEYVESKGAIMKAYPPSESGLHGMQPDKHFRTWFESMKNRYAPLSFTSVRLADYLLRASPDLQRVRKPWTGLEWDYETTYLAAARGLVHAEYAVEMRVGAQEPSLTNLALTLQGARAVKSDFRLRPALSPQVTVGAIIQTMSGGSVQAVGIAHDVEISQVVNDPELLRSQVDALAKNLLNEVKSSLNLDELAQYTEALRELKDQLLLEQPQLPVIRQLVRTVGLLGDIEGTIALITRVWTLLHPLLLIAEGRMG